MLKLDARCGGAARLSEFRVRASSSTTRPIPLSGCRSRSTAARSASASSSCAPTTRRASRPARCGLRSRTPRADAEIIGVIDADYVVHPDWLKDLVPAFRRSHVGLVQAPQDHRDGERSAMHHAMNGEYAGFFDIGMVQRNEANAIIVHGTMCLIRRAALEAAGGWSSDTICEDTDLGLTLLEHGWHRALHQSPLWPRPAARQFRGLQEPARPLGLWRLPDLEEALAPLPAGRQPAYARAEARIHARLAQLAGRREHRRAWSRCSISPGCRSSPSSTSPCPTAC